MRNALKALAFTAALLPGIALGQAPQFPKNLPGQSVVGRLGTTTGPSQAILFSQLAAQLFTNANLALNGAAGKVLGGNPGAFTATPTLGVASTTSGTLTLANSGNSGTVTIGAASTATTWTFKFPTTAGANGQALITDGSGNTSWAAGTGTVNSGTAGQLTYYATTAAAVTGNPNLTVSSGALTVGVATSQQGTVILAGSTSGGTTLAGQTSGGGTMTFPAGSDTVATIAATQTFTNKTLTSPTINTPTIAGGTLTALTGLAIRDASAAFDVTLAANSSSATISAGRTLTLDVGNVAHTVQFGTTANTITFPNVASDTVTMLTASQSVSNKTITASTYSGLTITTTTGTLTITSGKTFAASNTLTFAGTDGNTFTFPSGSDTVDTIAASQTLTNKTLTAPVINGGTAQALTNLGIRSSGGGAFDMVIANSETLTAQRALTVTLNNAARTISISGNITTAADFITAGANSLTLTTTGSTNVTMPTSGTLATTNTSQTFSGSNIFSALTQFTDLKFSSGKLYPTSNSTTALQVTQADGTTAFMTFDSTNKRVGINKTPGAFDLDVNGAANVGTTISFTTLDATSLASSTSTITGLTVNNSPNSSNDYLLYYSASDGKIRKATVGAIAAGATAGVSSLNGLTGGLSVVGSSNILVSASGSSVNVSTVSTPGGSINKFRNGAMDVWQRGTTALATATAAAGAHTADGWRVQQAGAAFTCAQDTGTAGALFSLNCVGGTSNTSTVFKQRIESYMAAPLASNTITVQVQYKQSTGGSITPKISTCFASATDNFTTCTSDLAATSVTACATATWCTESYTLNASGSASNGYEIDIDCNTALTSSQHCWITAADVRVTPGGTVGVNTSPPAPEFRNLGAETALCQRYYEYFGGTANYALGIGTINAATTGYIFVQFYVPMRIAPTLAATASNIITFGAGAGNFQTSAIASANISSQSTFIQGTISGATAGQAALGLIPTSTNFVTFTAEL